MNNDNSGDTEDSWYDSPEGRRSRIPPDVLQRIIAAGWKISKQNKEEAYIHQPTPDDHLDLIEDLKTAGITLLPSNGERNIVVKVKDLNDLVLGWRDISYPEEVVQEIANADWKRPGQTMIEAYVDCTDSDESEKLMDLLDKAGIEYTVTEPKEAGSPHTVMVRIDELDEIAPEWRKTSVTDELKTEILGAGWKFISPVLYGSTPANEAYITVTTLDELQAMTDKLVTAKIYYPLTGNDVPCSITVQAEDMDYLGTEWREAAIPPEVKEHILRADWHIEDKNAVFYAGFETDIAAMKKNLRNAGISCEVKHSRDANTKHSITVSIEEFEKAFPKWRDIQEARESEEAPLRIKRDAVGRSWQGMQWQEGLDPSRAVMFCKNKDDAEALAELLTTANIKANRQGESGMIVVVSADALRNIGINVKKAASEAAVESDDEQLSDARAWLRDSVKWDTPSAESPLARATFKNRGAVDGDISLAIDNLLALKCTQDLKRVSSKTLIRDPLGLTLVVNADALRKAVPEIMIEPFKHTPDLDEERGGGELTSGR